MRIKRILIIFLTFFLNYYVNGQISSPLDTVIYLEKDNIMIRVYGNNYRFYDSLGFHCYTIKLNSNNEIQTFDNGNIIKHLDYNISIDPVFIADTFNFGFARRVYSSKGSSMLDKINKTSNYYYSYNCVQCNNNHLELFLQKKGVTDTFFTDEMIFIVLTGGIEFTEEWYTYFKKNVLSGVKFSPKEKRRLNNKLLFSVEVDIFGITKSVSLISDLDLKKNKLINENINLLDFPKLQALISRGYPQLQKSVMIIEL